MIRSLKKDEKSLLNFWNRESFLLVRKYDTERSTPEAIQIWVNQLNYWNKNQLSFTIQCYDNHPRNYRYIVDRNAIYYRRANPAELNSLLVYSITYKNGFQGPVKLTDEYNQVLQRTENLMTAANHQISTDEFKNDWKLKEGYERIINDLKSYLKNIKTHAGRNENNTQRIRLFTHLMKYDNRDNLETVEKDNKIIPSTINPPKSNNPYYTSKDYYNSNTLYTFNWRDYQVARDRVDDLFGKNTLIVNGKAGTGKSTIIIKLLELHNSPTTLFVTPTYQSLVRVTGHFGGEIKFRNHVIQAKSQLTKDINLVIVDELSQIGDNFFVSALKDKFSGLQVFVFFGDLGQLEPVSEKLNWLEGHKYYTDSKTKRDNLFLDFNGYNYYASRLPRLKNKNNYIDLYYIHRQQAGDGIIIDGTTILTLANRFYTPDYKVLKDDTTYQLRLFGMEFSYNPSLYVRNGLYYYPHTERNDYLLKILVYFDIQLNIIPHHTNFVQVGCFMNTTVLSVNCIIQYFMDLLRFVREEVDPAFTITDPLQIGQTHTFETFLRNLYTRYFTEEVKYKFAYVEYNMIFKAKEAGDSFLERLVSDVKNFNFIDQVSKEELNFKLRVGYNYVCEDNVKNYYDEDQKKWLDLKKYITNRYIIYLKSIKPGSLSKMSVHKHKNDPKGYRVFYFWGCVLDLGEYGLEIEMGGEYYFVEEPEFVVVFDSECFFDGMDRYKIHEYLDVEIGGKPVTEESKSGKNSNSYNSYNKYNSYKSESDSEYQYHYNYIFINMNYACTIHKQQGSEFNNEFFIAANVSDDKLVYTAMTRAKYKLFVLGKEIVAKK